MAGAGARVPEGTPPPIIGKAGRYTVFITPPPTPKTPSGSPRPQGPCSHLTPVPVTDTSPAKAAAVPPPVPAKAPPSPPPPPVQVPPQQFGKPSSPSSTSAFGFFWGAVAKVQEVHSSLDEYLADWFGLNQSKYQWALNDYYEKKEMGKEAGQKKCPLSKIQIV
uniref:Putative NAD(+)--arginine ADP-ribosyltransferase Mav n=1 Tax=Anthurium amnicola TaxID=1678845 RepID=A0A1D1ZJE6_9ARAE